MPPNIHDVVGCLVISAWTNVWLFGLECCFVFSYFNKYRKDHLWIKLLVTAAWLNDLVATIVNCRSVYKFTVSGFGNVAGLTEPGPGVVIVTATVGSSVIFTQSYLIWRYFAISKNRYVSAFLAVLAVAGLGFNWFCCKKTSDIDSLADFESISIYVKVLVGIEAGTDVLISGALLLVLAQHYRESPFTGTKSMLLRLMLLSIESGAVTTAVAIAVLVTFVCAPHTNAGLATADNLGRVYTLTLLYNLHIRKSSLEESAEGSGQASSHNFPLSSVRSRKTEAQLAQSRDVLDQSIAVSLETGRRPSFSGFDEKAV